MVINKTLSELRGEVYIYIYIHCCRGGVSTATINVRAMLSAPSKWTKI